MAWSLWNTVLTRCRTISCCVYSVWEQAKAVRVGQVGFPVIVRNITKTPPKVYGFWSASKAVRCRDFLGVRLSARKPIVIVRYKRVTQILPLLPVQIGSQSLIFKTNHLSTTTRGKFTIFAPLYISLIVPKRYLQKVTPIWPLLPVPNKNLINIAAIVLILTWMYCIPKYISQIL